MLNLILSPTANSASDDVRHGLLPALALVRLPEDPHAAMALLAGVELFEPMPDGTMQADIDVPSGTWRLWPDRHVALWIGAQPEAVPAMRSDARLDLFETALALSDSGLKLRDLRVRTTSGWGRLMRAQHALRHLAEHPDVSAIRGVWADQVGRAVRAEIHSSGTMFAQDASVVWRVAEAIGAALDAG